MKIKSVYSHSFAKYGRVLTGYDTTELLSVLEKTTKKDCKDKERFKQQAEIDK